MRNVCITDYKPVEDKDDSSEMKLKSVFGCEARWAKRPTVKTEAVMTVNLYKLLFFKIFYCKTWPRTNFLTEIFRRQNKLFYIKRLLQLPSFHNDHQNVYKNQSAELLDPFNYVRSPAELCTITVQLYRPTSTNYMHIFCNYLQTAP